MGAIRLVFNAAALLGALVLACVLGVAALQGQPLPWGSLALGRLISDAGSIPGQEALLYNAPPGLLFDAHSWAWDWLASQAYLLWGAAPLRALDALALLVAALSLVAAAFRRGARPFSSAFFMAWALLAARSDLAPGPGLLVFAVFCASLWLLEGPFWQAFFNRWLWLPPLALVAVNLHQGAWALAALAGLWLLFSRDADGAPKQPALAKTLFFVVLLGCLSLHPQGPRALWDARLGLGPSPLWPGAFEARQGALLLLALAALLAVAGAWLRDGGGSIARDRALLLAFGLAGLASRDALPFALAVAAPMAALRSDRLADALPAGLRALRWPLKTLLLAAALALAWRQGLPSLRPAPAAPLPAQTAVFYEQELLDLHVLCPPAWTPWLAWRLAPHIRFALGPGKRVPALTRASLQRALQADPGWKEALDEQRVEACWLPLGSPLAVALATAQAWQPVSVDDASVLYLRQGPQTQELIRVYAPRGLRLGDPARPFDPSRLAQAEADLEMRLNRDPGLGVLYLFQAELWMAKEQPAKARQTLEAGIRADARFAGNYARLAELRLALGERAEARLLWQRALRLQDDPRWRQALAGLGAP